MPTFQFYKNKVKIDEVKGADPAALEAKIKQHIGSADADDDIGVPGHVSLVYIKHLFLYSPVHLSILPFIHSFIHSSIHSFIQSFIHSLIN